jgi:hypothetical protein
MPKNSTLTFERREVRGSGTTNAGDFREALSTGEEELVNELVHALRTIRYGSIAVTLHDGRIVEIQRTERIRTSSKKDQPAL